MILHVSSEHDSNVLPKTAPINLSLFSGGEVSYLIAWPGRFAVVRRSTSFIKVLVESSTHKVPLKTSNLVFGSVVPIPTLLNSWLFCLLNRSQIKQQSLYIVLYKNNTWKMCLKNGIHMHVKKR